MTGQLSVVLHVLRTAARADRRVVHLILALALLNAAAVPVTGVSLRWLVDSSRLGRLEAVAVAAAIGALAYAILAVTQRIQHNLQVDMAERVDVALSQEIYAAVAAVPTLEHLERPDYLDRLSQLEQSIEALAGVCWIVLGTFTTAASLGFSVWLLFDVHPALALLAVLAAPPLVASRYATRFLIRAKDHTAALTRRELRLHELCTTSEPAKELRISGSAGAVDARADDCWAAVTGELVAAQTKAALAQAAGWVLYSVGYVFALGLAAYLVSAGHGTLGGVILVASLASYLRGQLTNTVNGVGQLAEARHAVAQYTWLMAYAQRNRHASTGVPPRRLSDGIRLRDVAFRYPGTDTEVLRGVDLHLRAGSVVAVVGSNGAGKTTLIKLIAGMHRPSRGDIVVDGVPLTDLDASAWSSRITAAFQDYAKLQMRLRETVGVGDLPRIADGGAVGQAIVEAQASSIVERLPAGLETQLGTVFEGAELSHGQWQKLALARSMMRDEPLLWVLDEPTAALDPQAEHDLYERFVGSARHSARVSGGIILLVSHRFSTVSMADHIVVLSGGGVAEQGTHAELMRSGGEYAALYQTHARGYT